jgi:hypothetical protein
MNDLEIRLRALEKQNLLTDSEVRLLADVVKGGPECEKWVSAHLSKAGWARNDTTARRKALGRLVASVARIKALL